MSQKKISPLQSHPNCKCYVEVVQVGYKKGVKDIMDKKSEDKWIMPCEGKIVGYYGEVRPTHVHNGIDIAVPIGTPVKAVADGVVYYAGSNDPYGYGNYVIITHSIDGGTVTSEYGHLSSWNVKSGQQIKQGQVLGKSGNTGHSEGPHVHLTLRKGRYKGTPFNPNQYIRYCHVAF